ncbi:MAG: rhomboid family intramembrane serine protease [Pseudomonadota bacterium]
MTSPDPTPLQEQVRQRLLAALRGVPPATTALVVGVALVHLGVGLGDWLHGRALAGGHIAGLYDVLLGERSGEGLLRWGANDLDGVGQGALWRLPASTFLHANALHLALNGLALFGLGRLSEAIWGRARFLALFLAAGVGGAALSHLGRALTDAGGDVASLSVGASGAIFGLMGAGVVFGRRFRRQLPRPARDLFWRGLVPWIALNLFIGITVPRIDNLGHLGGLAVGALGALLLGSPVIPGAEGHRWATPLLAFLCAALLGWTAGSMVLGG